MVFDFIKRHLNYIFVPLCIICISPVWSFNSALMFFPSTVSCKISPNPKQVWMDYAVKRLSSVDSVPETARVFAQQLTAFNDFYKLEFQVRGEGFIRFDNGDWICFITHSSHDDEEIGDVTVARDNHGRVFYNKGHICGGVISFFTKERNVKLNAHTFFDIFLSDSDNEVWVQMILH